MAAKPRRPTFHQVLERSRAEAAAVLWEGAVTASRLRHELIRLGHWRAARQAGEIKTRYLERLAEILPGEVTVTIDRDYCIGLTSVRWPGHGRLHLAAGCLANRIA